MLFELIELPADRGCELGGAAIVDLIPGYWLTGTISFAFLTEDNTGSWARSVELYINITHNPGRVLDGLIRPNMGVQNT